MRDKVQFYTTFAKLKEAGACEEGYKKLAKLLGGITKYGRNTPVNLLHILDSNGANDCLWALRAVDHPDRDRIARHIACDCADAVLSIFERLNPNDSRPRNAIATARAFAEGQGSNSDLAAARAAAGAAAWAAAWAAARAAARAAAGTAQAAAWAAAWAAARAAAGTAQAAAWAAARAAAGAAGDAQTIIIRGYLS